MRLTQQQRTELFAGRPCKITFPGAAPCPIAVGHVEALSAHVWLEVTGTRRERKGDHVLVYTLHNNRARRRYLAPQDGQKAPRQYQHNGPSPVDPECGEAPEDIDLERMAHASHAEDRRLVGEYLTVLEDLRSAVKERLEMSPDAVRIMGRDAWALRSKIDATERRLKRRYAS